LSLKEVTELVNLYFSLMKQWKIRLTMELFIGEIHKSPLVDKNSLQLKSEDSE